MDILYWFRFFGTEDGDYSLNCIKFGYSRDELTFTKRKRAHQHSFDVYEDEINYLIGFPKYIEDTIHHIIRKNKYTSSYWIESEDIKSSVNHIETYVDNFYIREALFFLTYNWLNVESSKLLFTTPYGKKRLLDMLSTHISNKYGCVEPMEVEKLL
jgi:hypothetical protein